MRHAHEAGCTPRAPPLSVRRPSAGATEKPRCAATRLPRAAVLRGTSSCSTALALLRRKQNAEQSGVQQLLMNVTLSTQRRSGHFSVRHKAAANVTRAGIAARVLTGTSPRPTAHSRAAKQMVLARCQIRRTGPSTRCNRRCMCACRPITAAFHAHASSLIMPLSHRRSASIILMALSCAS